MERPRVYVIEIAGSGGIAHYTYSLLKHFDERVAPVLYTGDPYELDGLEGGFERRRVFRRFRTNPFKVLGMFRDALRERPCAVHVQLSQYPAFVLGLVGLFRLLGFPVVTTAHNPVSHEEKRWELAAFKAIYRMSRAIVVHSGHTRDEIVRRFGLAPERIHVIDHGDYLLFGTEVTDSAPDPVFNILFFGYIRPYKGLAVLLEALGRLRDGPMPFRLDIVGRPVEPFDRFRRQIAALGLEDRVRARLDYVPIEEVGKHFASASVVVLPYLSASQSGVLQLAYAFGRPVIVTDTGGLPEAVEEGETGFVVPPGDAGALAGSLEKLMGDPALTEKMGRNARELARTRFAWSRIAPRNEDLYLSGES
jgi:glycosyltransferase involved in cell wall biosynthesis